MSGKTNENNFNNLNTEEDIELENAFSDLISQYFEEDNNIENLSNIQPGSVLDWDSVSNGQLFTDTTEKNKINEGNGIYTNLGTIYNGQTTENINNQAKEENPIYKNFNINGNNDQPNENAKIGLYNELGNLKTESTPNNVYNVISINNGLENENGIETAINGNGKEFKLTQGNLPAKIGFWTKVRNFFITGSKIQYSVQQQSQENNGVWNRLQTLFSFGKFK